MKNIDKEPTYYVSLTEYNEVKRMFLKANDEINKLKDLLKECSIANTALVGIMDWLRKSTIPEQGENCEELFKYAQELQKQLDEVLK